MLTFTAESKAEGIDRRRAPRQLLVVDAKLRPERIRGTPATGTVNNISSLGIGLKTEKPIPLGEHYRIRVEAGPMRWFNWIRVVSCRSNEPGSFEVGAEFVSPRRSNDLDYEAPQALAA